MWRFSYTVPFAAPLPRILARTLPQHSAMCRANKERSDAPSRRSASIPPSRVNIGPGGRGPQQCPRAAPARWLAGGDPSKTVGLSRSPAYSRPAPSSHGWCHVADTLSNLIGSSTLPAYPWKSRVGASRKSWLCRPRLTAPHGTRPLGSRLLRDCCSTWALPAPSISPWCTDSSPLCVVTEGQGFSQGPQVFWV